MNLKSYFFYFIILICFIFKTNAQNVALYNQFNGRYDFTFIGNTMNLGENNITPGCQDLLITSSSATLNLTPNQIIEKAYLYWAGSGLGDFNVTLNNNNITAQRNFSFILTNYNLPFFSAFADVTNQMVTTGNGIYTLSDLDISQTLIENSDYCSTRTNFAGWAIVIIYKDTSLPINQINVYDGLQGVPNDLTINLSSLNVLDTNNSKAGFIAWEGDASLATESFYFNGNLLSNTLNPQDNVFNGTNTITGSSTLYNMDLDIYDIQNNIAIGDTSANISLTSYQDFVMINTVVTKLNSQLPDATIAITTVQKQCDSKDIIVDYTVSNTNGTAVLPAHTPVAIYVNGIFLQSTLTAVAIPIGGSINAQIALTLPANTAQNFLLKFVVDDIGNGTGIVPELNENNNTFSLNETLWVTPQINILPDLFSCVTSFQNQSVDFSSYANLVKVNTSDAVHFFTTLSDATANINPITNSANFIVNGANTTIYVRVANQYCDNITSFNVHLVLYPSFNNLNDLFTCRINSTTTFDFSLYETSVKVTISDSVHFFLNLNDASSNINSITNITQYLPTTTPTTIYVRIDNGHCYSTTSFVIDYHEIPKFNLLPNLLSCNEGFTRGTFDFSSYEDLVKTNPSDNVRFYESLENATTDVNPILTPSNYSASTTPKEIFIRVFNQNCFSITSFLLTTRNCPPTVHNFVSANNDTLNDTFTITGLHNIFLDFKLEIYSRWGRLLWTGNQNTEDWDGYVHDGIGSKNAPDGTYFYLLFLNDIDYPEPLSGFLYLNH